LCERLERGDMDRTLFEIRGGTRGRRG